jgi:hypothetical protein
MKFMLMDQFKSVSTCTPTSSVTLAEFIPTLLEHLLEVTLYTSLDGVLMVMELPIGLLLILGELIGE